MPCCYIPIIPRILTFDRDLVPPKFEMLWINWTSPPPIYASNNIIFILCHIFDPFSGGKVAIQSLVKIIEGSYSHRHLKGSSVKCCFQLLDDIFWNWRLTSWRLKWSYLIAVFPFHTEFIASVAFAVALFIFFKIYLFVGSFDDPEQGGELFCFRILMQSGAGILSWAPDSPAGFPAKAFNLLLDFWQRLLNPDIWHPQRLLDSKIWNHQRLLDSKI